MQFQPDHPAACGECGIDWGWSSALQLRGGQAVGVGGGGTERVISETKYSIVQTRIKSWCKGAGQGWLPIMHTEQVSSKHFYHKHVVEKFLLLIVEFHWH
jgi:hypothetical protein